VYRSGELCQLGPAAQDDVIKLGIRTIIDLREEEEASLRPNVFRTSEVLTYRGVPFWEQPPPADSVVDISRGYHRELDLRGERLTSIICSLTEPRALPALIHCAAGKDRTGVLIGLLLASLRVPDEHIVEDYVLSRTCLGEPYLEESRKWVADRGWDWEDVAHLYDSPPHRMQNTLDHLQQKWGGAESYLLHHGLQAEALRKLRDVLTVEA
jgi:protein-tyrosine phosphatase